MTEPLVVLKDLKLYFPVISGLFRKISGYLQAVNGVDLTIRRGEIHSLVGESGSGKSTLGRTAIRLLKPTSGEIWFDSIRLDTLNSSALKPFRRRMQMIFQDPLASLNPRHTVGRAIGEGMLLHGLAEEGQDLDVKVGEIFELVGLPKDSGHRYPFQFSGGQLQRICIGRALALKPEFIVCDEAVSALDVSIQAQILNLLNELKNQFSLTLLFIAHDLELVKQISDHVTVLYLGKVMESGTKEEVFSNPKHPYTRALFASAPKKHPNEMKEKLILKGEIPSPLHPPSGCPFRTRCPHAQKICAETIPLKTPSSSHRYFCILD